MRAILRGFIEGVFGDTLANFLRGRGQRVQEALQQEATRRRELQDQLGRRGLDDESLQNLFFRRMEELYGLTDGPELLQRLRDNVLDHLNATERERFRLVLAQTFFNALNIAEDDKGIGEIPEDEKASAMDAVCGTIVDYANNGLEALRADGHLDNPGIERAQQGLLGVLGVVEELTSPDRWRR
jgi:hypothetical protein